MKTSSTILLLFLLCTINLFAQEVTQTIKGTVIDKQSQVSLPGVTIIVIGSNPLKGSSSDADGRFKITDIIPGRYDLKAAYLGYKEIIISNVVVTSGKEVYLDVAMEENVNNLKEVVVSGSKKNETINEMVSNSARSFSMEEVNRYAGGRSDPSRLAANFAGVSSPWEIVSYPLKQKRYFILFPKTVLF
jgi:hypothetical protein